MISWLKYLLVVGVVFLIVVLPNLPYLPGPQSMSRLSHHLHNGASMLFFVILLATPVVVVWLIVSLIRRKGRSIIPAAFLFVACLHFFGMWYLSPYLGEISRERSISEATPVVEAIERFNTERGTYPDSLSLLIPQFLDSIPRPSSMGSLNYGYRAQDSLFELRFQQSVFPHFNFEVVVYNPHGLHLGEGETPTLHDTSVKKWKYFIFD